MALTRGMLTILTTTAVLAHAVLGCCWHHGHVDGCQHSTARSVDAERAETVTAAPVCACGHQHGESTADSRTADVRSGAEPSGEAPLPAPVAPCTHGRCSYVGVSDAKLRAAVDAAESATIIADMVARTRPASAIGVARRRDDGPAPPGATTRLLSQVWLI